MKKLRLLLLAALLTAIALPSAAAPWVASGCVFYCWHGPDGESCCQMPTCEIRCS